MKVIYCNNRSKKAGVDLRQALDQATEYAKLLDVPIVFAMNGAYCETRFCC
ncbi:Type I restriction-modification system methyltransferase subunit [Rickettsia rickettsii str. Arizona]|uniref:hypothetical protein n=1 Tax=Rickettsia rickettsii TaxID=783 RepID=UPI00024F9E1D|nr:hypothetical protein [Rickettsia rickettsii]AFB25606.1 Type I restriction-modification system methyltransferase subunit [Rickettsia rickettsii str. Arizona]AFB28286.1 Type I restriction-modification system methyltransferase subunit [Rickettsia rickettsii str. Hino]